MLLFANRAFVRTAACLLIAFAADAGAQTFPGSGWLPLTQGGAVLADPFDNTFANPAIDVVGDKDNPGAFVASDAGYLYFRVRVAGNPVSPITHHYSGYLWSCLLDFDQDLQTYELLTGLDALASSKTVDLDQNIATGTPDDVGDAAETQLVSYDAAVNAQSAPSGSALGGGNDYFVDWAIAWANLNSGGLAKSTAFRLVCGTSTSAVSLSGGDALDSGLGSKSFSADASDTLLCSDSGCQYDALFNDGFEGP
jgi:hypothetical protein